MCSWASVKSKSHEFYLTNEFLLDQNGTCIINFRSFIRNFLRRKCQRGIRTFCYCCYWLVFNDNKQACSFRSKHFWTFFNWKNKEWQIFAKPQKLHHEAHTHYFGIRFIWSVNESILETLPARHAGVYTCIFYSFMTSLPAQWDFNLFNYFKCNMVQTTLLLGIDIRFLFLFFYIIIGSSLISADPFHYMYYYFAW